MVEPLTPALWHGAELAQAWVGQAAWRVLDTGFDRGLDFLRTWQAWRNDPQRPRMLHYVALMPNAPSWAELEVAASAWPPLRPLLDELALDWSDLLPGFHRLLLDDGHVLLTLCVGPTTALLRAQQFVVDSLFLNPAYAHWDAWTAKALARCCRRGTWLGSAAAIGANVRADLVQCGFEWATPLRAVFNPRWIIKTTRRSAPAQTPLTVGRCAVIGAGLAGASVAAALARRGWQVRVLDQAPTPAAGASGLPVGLVVPYVSVDDCALSHLSRAGVRLMLQQARQWLRPGQDWSPSGTLERQVDDAALDAPGHWHAQAAWLKPAQLVRAWLAQPGVTFMGQAQVSALERHGDEWCLLNAQGVELARADQVVLANACGAVALMQTLQARQPDCGVDWRQLPALHGVRGLLSWAWHHDTPTHATFLPFPINGAGSVVPRVPVEGGLAWFVGSSYQPAQQPEASDAHNHGANLARLAQLMPQLAQTLAPQWTEGRVQGWKGTRCVSVDRLPLVGPLDAAQRSGLWMCAAMGSRGLSFSVLCAELLAARWGAEPLPIEAHLAQNLTALRATPAQNTRQNSV